LAPAQRGWVQCDYAYTATGATGLWRRVRLPASLVANAGLATGRSRLEKSPPGDKPGVWETYNDTITGWRGWCPGSKAALRAAVDAVGNTEGLITAVPERSGVFVQVLTPEAPPTNLVGKTAVQLPQAGLAFLHAIPPIGSKFKDAGTSGPQGQLTVAAGEYQGSARFYFGTLP
jgi:hypothetical protein